LNSDYFRENDITKESWTKKDVEGERLADVPLFILTSHKTFSAAESFAYDMKVRNRAIIIGDSTRGGAHSVDLFKINEQFEIYISTVRSFNPLTESNWEGTGVIPDIFVPAEFALDTAIVYANKAAIDYGKIKDAEMKQAVLKMQYQLDCAEKLYQDCEDSLAAAFLDSAFQTGIEADLVNEFFVQVLAYEYQSAEDDRILFGILKKNTDLFPYSCTAYEMLAWAYLKRGDEDKAIQNFQKELELDPNNSIASQMLKKLKKE
jgi:tetratricopeptide (TPR) repeat protein